MKKLIHCTIMAVIIFLFSVSVCVAWGHRRILRPLYENNRGIVPHFVTPCCETHPKIVIPQQELEIIIIPEETQPPGFQHQPPWGIPIPELPIPHVSVPHTVVRPKLRRIDPSRAPTNEKHITGEVICPPNLPKGSIVRVCNARSGNYKFPDNDYNSFHQQQCWLCENILGGEYVRWQDHIQ